MKLLTVVSTLLIALNSFALTLEDVTKPGLIIKDSRGPRHGDEIAADAIYQWEKYDDFYNLFDDGMNHDAREQCEPEAYQLWEAEVVYEEDPALSVRFESIKKTESGRTIAYRVMPQASYKVAYEYYLTKDDYKARKLTKETVICTVDYSQYFYYENTKDKTIKFLGIK